MLTPGLVAVQLFEGTESAFRAVVAALDNFPIVTIPWPGARADLGLSDEWRWVLQVSPGNWGAPMRLDLQPDEAGTTSVFLLGTSEDTLQVIEAIRFNFRAEEVEPPRSNGEGTITRRLIVTPSQRAPEPEAR